MNGTKNYLLDTNIVLQLLNGDKILAAIINNKLLHVSFITEMELLSYYKLTDGDRTGIKIFLNDCNIIEMNSAIKSYAIKIRQNYRLKLPDSIIAATGEFLKMSLLTSDIDFDKLKSIQILQYKI